MNNHSLSKMPIDEIGQLQKAAREALTELDGGASCHYRR